MKVADEVWTATALLHVENPGREDFSPTEIVRRALKENLAGRYRAGLMAHASNHCVASKAPNPARLRMLHDAGRGRRRLFRPGDPCHRQRRRGKMRPEKSDLPPEYQHLIDWYENVYARNGHSDARKLPRGGTAEDFLRLAGGISPEDLDLMEEAIKDCERIDWREW